LPTILRLETPDAGEGASVSRFEFFMAFYGLLLGLGVAELLGGFANLLRQKSAPRLGVVTPLIGGIVLVEMLANFIDAWVKFQDIDIALVPLVVPTLIGLTYFVIAVIVIPRDPTEWGSLDEYMALRRRWIVGLLILANILIASMEFTRLERTFSGGSTASLARWLAANAWLLGSYALIWWGRSRLLIFAAASSVFLFYLVFYAIVPLI
jgi:hypothetical protein